MRSAKEGVFKEEKSRRNDSVHCQDVPRKVKLPKLAFVNCEDPEKTSRISLHEEYTAEICAHEAICIKDPVML